MLQNFLVFQSKPTLTGKPSKGICRPYLVLCSRSYLTSSDFVTVTDFRFRLTAMNEKPTFRVGFSFFHIDRLTLP